MKKILIIGIIVALSLLILGCNDRYGPLTPKEELNVKLGSVNLPNEYSVNCHYGYSSSGGDRDWNIIYDITNENFVSCSGNYHFSGSDGEKDEECTIDMLQKDGIHIFSTMSDIIKIVNTNFKTEVFELNATDRDCYYVLNEDGYAYGVVCFNVENEIVTYLAKGGYGGAETIWLLDGYELTDEVEELMG